MLRESLKHTLVFQYLCCSLRSVAPVARVNYAVTQSISRTTKKSAFGTTHKSCHRSEPMIHFETSGMKHAKKAYWTLLVIAISQSYAGNEMITLPICRMVRPWNKVGNQPQTTKQVAEMMVGCYGEVRGMKKRVCATHRIMRKWFSQGNVHAVYRPCLSLHTDDMQPMVAPIVSH